MALTENAKTVYLCTDLGNFARETEYDSFKSRWFAKLLILSMSKKEDDQMIFKAMKNIDSFDFYLDANK